VIDVFIILGLFLSVLYGYLRGALYHLLGLLAMVTAYAGSAAFGEGLGGCIARHWGTSASGGYVAARVITGILIYVSLKIGAGVANRRLGKTELGVTRRWNRHLGAACGLLWGVGVALVVLFVLDSVARALPEDSNAFLNAARQSKFRRLVSGINPADRLLLTDGLSLLRRARDDPQAFRRLADTPQVREILEEPAIRNVLDDQGLRTAMESKDLAAILNNENLRALLGDRDLMRRLVSPETRAALREAMKAGAEGQGEAPPP